MEQKKAYIFGAHSRAQTLSVYLTALYPELEIKQYLFDNEEPNMEYIDGIAVTHIDKNTRLDIDIPVYIAVKKTFHAHIISLLQEIGMKSIIPVTPELDIELRNRFLIQYYTEHGRTFEKINCDITACVYILHSINDKPLNEPYELMSYHRKLQVGAALTDKKIANLTDDSEENISNRNRQFCELTGLYWIWKHAREDIIGLEHYRRHFLLPQDWINRMEWRHIDVILPTPLYVLPSIAENYKKRHIASDWDYMMDYLKEFYSVDYDHARSFFNTNLYSPCNMFIMRRHVLDELCKWLFPILFACAEHGGQRADKYQNRYPGFLSERLMTYFFDKNQDRYKIIYADKNFLS